MPGLLELDEDFIAHLEFMKMAKARWHYATEEELELIEKLPENKTYRAKGIYTVLRGTVRDREGNEHTVPDRMVLKILDADNGEPWCYRTIYVEIVEEKLTLLLRPGIPVALWSPSKVSLPPPETSSEKPETSNQG